MANIGTRAIFCSLLHLRVLVDIRHLAHNVEGGHIPLPSGGRTLAKEQGQVILAPGIYRQGQR